MEGIPEKTFTIYCPAGSVTVEVIDTEIVDYPFKGHTLRINFTEDKDNPKLGKGFYLLHLVQYLKAGDLVFVNNLHRFRVYAANIETRQHSRRTDFGEILHYYEGYLEIMPEFDFKRYKEE